MAAATLAACFSERSETTEPPGGDAALCGASPPAGTVQMRNFAFVPTEVRVRPGTSVTWVNCEGSAGAPHTSTSDRGVWDSPLLGPNQTFVRTFAQAGRFPYHCEPHPFMTATVVVE